MTWGIPRSYSHDLIVADGEESTRLDEDRIAIAPIEHSEGRESLAAAYGVPRASRLSVSPGQAIPFKAGGYLCRPNRGPLVEQALVHTSAGEACSRTTVRRPHRVTVRPRTSRRSPPMVEPMALPYMMYGAPRSRPYKAWSLTSRIRTKLGLWAFGLAVTSEPIASALFAFSSTDRTSLGALTSPRIPVASRNQPMHEEHCERLHGRRPEVMLSRTNHLRERRSAGCHW